MQPLTKRKGPAATTACEYGPIAAGAWGEETAWMVVPATDLATLVGGADVAREARGFFSFAGWAAVANERWHCVEVRGAVRAGEAGKREDDLTKRGA
jgi:hypothetical protein